MGFGRGKVILLGEHAVVHGYPAIAVGIERGVHAEAEVAERDLLRLDPWDLTLEPDREAEEPLARAFSAVLDTYDNRPPLEVRATAELPAGAGLGCSAAIGSGPDLGRGLPRKSLGRRQHHVGGGRRRSFRAW